MVVTVISALQSFGRRRAVRVLACSVSLVATFSVASTGIGTAPALATTPTCTAANTYVWAPYAGGGTAGTIYYVLEFSNVGTTTCALSGFARVWGVTTAGALVGRPASHEGAAAAVTLAPDQTAHAILGVVDTGALCGTHGVRAAGLRVVPPGQILPPSPGERDEVENFPLEVCSNESSMHVDPIRAGTGIPLHTTS